MLLGVPREQTSERRGEERRVGKTEESREEKIERRGKREESTAGRRRDESRWERRVEDSIGEKRNLKKKRTHFKRIKEPFQAKRVIDCKQTPGGSWPWCKIHGSPGERRVGRTEVHSLHPLPSLRAFFCFCFILLVCAWVSTS
jgi:hypothetical protein